MARRSSMALVRIGRLIQGQGEAEDFSWADFAIPDKFDQIRQEASYGAGPPCRWIREENSSLPGS